MWAQLGVCMKLIERLKKITQGFKAVWSRFPAAILAFVVIGASVSIFFVHDSFQLSEEHLKTIGYALLALSIFAVYGIAVTVLAEEKQYSVAKRALLWAANVLAALAYFVYVDRIAGLEARAEQMRIAGILLLGVVLFAADLLRRKKGHSEIFAQRRAWRLLVTGFFWGVIAGGISFILFSMDRMLGVHVESEAYSDAFILTGAVFAPSFFLMELPSNRQSSEEALLALFKVLLLYVLMPLIWAYTAIVGIYFVKLLITWQWPDGVIANLILWYVLAGIGTLYFSNTLKGENRWSTFFARWFPRAVILPTLLLFVSLAIRINQYGITENRYLVGIAGLWVLGCAVYLSVKNLERQNTKVITGALAALILVSVIGPLSASSVSSMSQNRRFERVLQANGLLDDNQRATEPETALPTAQQRELNEMIRYFSEVQQTSKIRSLPETMSREALLTFFKITETELYTSEYVWAYLSDAEILDVSGYDYMVRVSQNQQPYQIDTERGSIKLAFGPYEDQLQITLNEAILYHKALSEDDERIIALCRQVQSESRDLTSEEAVLQLEETSDIKVKILLKSASIDLSNMESAKYGIEYIILFSIK